MDLLDIKDKDVSKIRQKGVTMSRKFDLKELVRVAVIDERSGKELYKKMSERAHNVELRKKFTWLVGQEKLHQERFERMLEELESKKEKSFMQYPDEYVDYLELLAAEGGQTEAHRRIQQSTDDLDLVELAIRFERDQLSLQRDMGTVLGESYRPIIDEIINEEISHLVALAKEKKKLTGQIT